MSAADYRGLIRYLDRPGETVLDGRVPITHAFNREDDRGDPALIARRTLGHLQRNGDVTGSPDRVDVLQRETVDGRREAARGSDAFAVAVPTWRGQFVPPTVCRSVTTLDNEPITTRAAPIV
jgi:hypothetical protein